MGLAEEPSMMEGSFHAVGKDCADSQTPDFNLIFQVGNAAGNRWGTPARQRSLSTDDCDLRVMSYRLSPLTSDL